MKTKTWSLGIALFSLAHPGVASELMDQVNSPHCKTQRSQISNLLQEKIGLDHIERSFVSFSKYAQAHAGLLGDAPEKAGWIQLNSLQEAEKLTKDWYSKISHDQVLTGPDNSRKLYLDPKTGIAYQLASWGHQAINDGHQIAPFTQDSFSLYAFLPSRLQKMTGGVQSIVLDDQDNYFSQVALNLFFSASIRNPIDGADYPSPMSIRLNPHCEGIYNLSIAAFYPPASLEILQWIPKAAGKIGSAETQNPEE